MGHMNQSAHLYRLQQIDSQLDQIHTRLKQIEKTLSEDSRILDARKRLDECHRQLEKSRFRLHNAEELVRHLARGALDQTGGALAHPGVIERHVVGHVVQDQAQA